MENIQPPEPLEPNDNSENSIQKSQIGANTATKVAKLLHRIAADEIEKYEHGKTFPFPFFVDEEFLKKIEAMVLEQLEKIQITENVEFKSETRFQDISTIRFYAFNDFLDKAGNKKDPESTLLSWSKFELSKEGEPIAGGITIAFVTEKRLKTQDSPP